ncbi:MAG: c-type cytochrome [Verrucomicrobiae bacterium]|nr:c-type cytochrome [Verrucomicrobiae bacterium]MDW8308451.1 cbb3-type cytochrome c oxidase N-terminal domain-containing protein [Verrucomicrobiales bacterium]
MNEPLNETPEPLLPGHEYDGIRELDNKLPRWWVWTFYVTILFSVGYLTYYHVLAMGDLSAAEYEKEMRIGNAIKAAAIAKFEGTWETLQPSTDPAVLARGKATFQLKCAPCHRHDGGGLVGPNLTDDFWIHGSKFADNVRIIWNGVKEKGMLAWKEQGMKPDEVIEVASYIYTLRGAKLEKPGKPPENLAPVQTGPSEFE